MNTHEERALDIEQEKLKFERQKHEDSQRLAAKTYELEQRKLENENRFTNKHLTTFVTGIVSLAAVLVSMSQVYVAYTSKQKEIELANISKKAELDMNALEHRREWNLKAVDFVASHRDLIFGANSEQRVRVTNVMLVTFPPEITSALFEKLADSAPSSEAKTEWSGAQTSATKLLLVRTDGLYQARTGTENSFLRFFPDGTVMAVGTTPDASAQDVARWLWPGSNNSRGKIDVASATDHGALQIKGASIKFSTQSREGMVDYTGTVQNDRITIDWYSHINSARGTDVFDFVRVTQ